MLDKRLKLGGLQVGGPRTAQNPARFRVANNVYQTRDNYTVPRFHNSLSYSPGEFYPVVSHSSYQKQPFSICRNLSNNKFKFFLNSSTEIPMYGIAASDFSAPDECDSFGPQCVEKFGNLYVNFPYYGLHKYDGTQFYKAGVPLPYFSSTERADAGAVYMRVIQHHIDFQGNVVNSGYVEFRATPTGANKVTIRHDKNAVDIIGNTAVSPNIRGSRFDGAYDEHYWVASGAGVINTGTREITIPTGGNHNVAVGAYLVVAATYQPIANTGFSGDALAVAVKVKSSGATSVVVDMNNAKWLDVYGTWNTEGLSNTTVLFVGSTNGGNYWMSAWATNVSTGNYVYRDLWLCLYNSTSSQTRSVDVASVTTPTTNYDKTAFNLSGNLGDIYDVTTVKDVFPASNAWTFNSNSFPLSFTTYGDLAVICSESIVSFSDSSLGGSFEMVNGLSFLVAGEGSDGKVQAVCGNSDFLVVSRQNRNYYLAGNLPTGNYRVQPITNTNVGSYSNESVISYEDKIILFNAQGIWAIYSGGRCEEISENINGLFQNWSDTTQFSEETFFDVSAYPTYKQLFQTPDQWVRVRADVQRGLISFLIKGDGTGAALILNMNNGEFYTWSGFAANQGLTNPKVKDLSFINGEYYIALNYEDGGGYLYGNVYKELKTGGGQYDYVPSAYPIRLDTTWFTAGEPSLEKKLLQIKMFGVITGGVDVSHYLDWNTSEIDDKAYANQDATLFSHKHRLTSANFLAVSVSIDIEPGSGRFELEGMEIEFEPFQMGMKR